MRLHQSGRATGTISGRCEAEGRAIVPGEFLEAADQPCVAWTGVVWGDGDYSNVLWRLLWPH